MKQTDGTAIKTFLDGLPAAATRFALATDSVSGKMRPVARGFPDESKHDMASRFWKNADERSEEADGKLLRFSVMAYDDEKQVIDSLTFSVGDDDDDDMPPNASPPGGFGGTGLDLSKHVMVTVAKREALSMKMMAQSERSLRATNGAQSKQIEILNDELRELRAEARKEEKNRQKLKSKAHKRALRQLEAQENSIFKSFFLERLVDGSAILFDHFKHGGEKHPLRVMFQSLRPEQSEALLGNFAEVLDAGQMAPLVEWIESGAKAETAHNRLNAASMTDHAAAEKKKTKTNTKAKTKTKTNGGANADA